MRAVSLTNKGGRENNEDYVASAHVGGLWCFVLCDGLGGHSFGEIASEFVCSNICKAFEEKPELSQEALRGYIEKATEKLEEARKKEKGKSDMASTVVALITDGIHAVWAHVGDSRLYYIVEGEIDSITDDHSAAFLQFEKGDITYDDIRRSPKQNELLKTISTKKRLAPDISEITEVYQDDAFLLCSDGFWEFVTEDDIEEALMNAASPKEWLESMLEVLHKNETENNDNYSAIAIMI